MTRLGTFPQAFRRVCIPGKYKRQVGHFMHYIQRENVALLHYLKKIRTFYFGCLMFGDVLSHFGQISEKNLDTCTKVITPTKRELCCGNDSFTVP